MKKIKITEPVYGTGVNIIISNREEFVKYAEKLGWNISDGIKIADGYCDAYGRGAIVWLDHFGNKPSDKSLLIHELTHVAIRLFGTMRIKTTTENSEPFAYYMGFLVEEFYKKFNKK